MNIMRYTLSFFDIKFNKSFLKKSFLTFCFSAIINAHKLFYFYTPFLINNTEKTKVYNFKIKGKFLTNKITKTDKNSAIQTIVLEIIKKYKKGNISCITMVPFENENFHNTVTGINYIVDLHKPFILYNIIKNNFLQCYLGMNKYISTNFGIKPHYDIMFSGMPFSNKELFIRGNKVIDHFVYIPNHSSPLYFVSTKISDTYYCQLGVRNKGFQNFLDNYDLTKFL